MLAQWWWCRPLAPSTGEEGGRGRWIFELKDSQCYTEDLCFGRRGDAREVGKCRQGSALGKLIPQASFTVSSLTAGWQGLLLKVSFAFCFKPGKEESA